MDIANPLGREDTDRLLKAMLVISRTVEHVLESRAVEDACGPLSRPRVQILRLLGQRGHQGSTQIARYLGVSKPAVSQIIDSMVREKLVVRTISRHDRRGVELKLSAKGRKAFQKVLGEQRHMIRNAVRQAAGANAIEWIQTLERISGALARADKAFQQFCLQCGAHADGTCVLVGGDAECLFLQNDRKLRRVRSGKAPRTRRSRR